MPRLLLLALLSSLFAFVLAQSTKSPPPAFLQGLSSEARKEFAQIAGNRKITRLDLRNQVYAWADKYGVRSQVEDYLNKKNAAKKAERDRIGAAIDQLRSAFDTLNSLGDDDSLTQEQAEQQIKEKMQGYSWELKELLRLAGPANMRRKPSTAAAAA